MKAPLEHLESSTPMSAGEGTLYALIGGALIGLGFVVGWTRASLKSANEIKEELKAERRAGSSTSRGANRNTKP